MVLQPETYKGLLTRHKGLFDRSLQISAVARRCDGDGLDVTAGALDEWVFVKLVLKNILDDGKIGLRSVRRLLEALDETGIEEGLRQRRDWKMESEAVE